MTTTRPGGRTARVRAAVLAAAFDELVAVGYGPFSMESVARRADVHKTTVYRNWGSREALIAAAVQQHTAQAVPMPDTGAVADDLHLVAQAIVANIAAPDSAQLVRAFVSEAHSIPEIRQAGRAFWAERFGLVADVVRRGIDRGELPADTDAELLVEAIVAPLYLRLLVTDRPISAKYAERVVDSVLSGHWPH
jgi:AcrR family transcriptional regulator